MTRVIVTGSRNWSSATAVHQALKDAYRQLGPFTLVHGACPTGADRIAADWAATNDAFGITAEPHPADWAQHGRAAGPIRNRVMVEAGADLVLAFPFGASRGTWGTVRLAEAAGISVRIIRAQGEGAGQ